MNDQEIYRQLWCSDDAFARMIARDLTVSAFLRVWALIKMGRRGEAKRVFDMYNKLCNEPSEEMFRQELVVFFKISQISEDDLNHITAGVVNRFPWAVYSRLLLGTIAEKKREYHVASDAYEEVLNICRSNPAALAGLARMSILLKEKERAHSILTQIKRDRLFEGLNLKKKVYWHIIFFTYRIATGKLLFIRLIIAFLPLLAAFFPPIVWAIPAVMFILCLVFGLYYFKKDGLVVSILLLLAVSILFNWLIGIGGKILFLELEGYR